MRTFLKTLLQILDGTPRRQRIGQRGQSLVEMTVITPLLAIMIVGVVEIGWYANHYMIILEVTRVGARQGTVLQGASIGPLAWDNAASIHPMIYEPADPSNPTYPHSWYKTYRENAAMVNWDVNYYPDNGGVMPEIEGNKVAETFRSQLTDCSDMSQGDFGYYNTIACTMARSLDPLDLRYGEYNTVNRSGQVAGSLDYPDDIVISLFTLQKIYNDDPANVATDAPHYPQTVDLGVDYPPGHNVIVVGRYPTNANECDIYLTNPSNPDDLRDGGAFITEVDPIGDTDTDDPFDYIDGVGNAVGADHVQNQTSLDLGDGKIRTAFTEIGEPDFRPEIQRGFSWTGQHFIEEEAVPPGESQAYPVLCFGSDWSDDEVEVLMNGADFFSVDERPQREDYASDFAYEAARDAWDTAHANDATLQEELSHLPGQGLILVEMHWHHDTLLGFPFLDAFLNIFGDMQNVTISSWAAFPVPTIESSLVYQLP
ncbi:MAG: TadE family protein [Aggregatilineales bacterium]